MQRRINETTIQFDLGCHINNELYLLNTQNLQGGHTAYGIGGWHRGDMSNEAYKIGGDWEKENMN